MPFQLQKSRSIKWARRRATNGEETSRLPHIMRLYYRTLRYSTKAFPKPGKHTWPPTDQVTTVNCPCACYEGIWESGGKAPLIPFTRSVYKMSGSASRPDSLITCTNWKGHRVGLDAFCHHRKSHHYSSDVQREAHSLTEILRVPGWGKLVKWPSNTHAPSSVFYAFHGRPKVTKALNFLQSTRFWERSNAAWPFRGQPTSSGHAVLTAEPLGSTAKAFWPLEYIP
jgi:hypothetical protein